MYSINTAFVTDVQLFFFRVTGLWPHEDSGRLYYYFGVVFQFIFSFAYTIFMLINLFMLDNVVEITANLYMALTELALFVKIANFFVRIDAMQEMFRSIQSFQLDSIEEEHLINRRLKFFLKISIYYYGCANMAVVTSMISTLLSTEVKLPFYGWYVVDWRENRQHYWAVFAYQIIGMYITANLNITIELFPMLLMYMASVQMEILGRRMRKIGWRQNTTTFSSEKSDETIDQTELLVSHQSIITSIRTHESVCR